MVRPLLLILLMICTVSARAGLEVNVDPQNEQVKDNIEAFVGKIEADSRREIERIARHSKEPVSYTHLTLPTTPYV